MSEEARQQQSISWESMAGHWAENTQTHLGLKIAGNRRHESPCLGRRTVAQLVQLCMQKTSWSRGAILGFVTGEATA